MRRRVAGAVGGLLLFGVLTGCSDAEEECESAYQNHQEELTGIRPSYAAADRACDRDSTRSYYGGSASRGGGSGFGK